MAEKALVLFSGGVDSTTCLGLAIERYGKENVIALSVSYGQKHRKKLHSIMVWSIYIWIWELSSSTVTVPC